jgi:hypothetical protein
LLLEEIQTKLQEIDSYVFYGMADEEQITSKWDYTVFMRRNLSISDTKQGYTDRYAVAIVRENFIPEGLETQVINKMLEIAGMRIASTDCQYNYVKKPNTNIVVEILTIEFVKARKRVVA